MFEKFWSKNQDYQNKQNAEKFWSEREDGQNKQNSDITINKKEDDRNEYNADRKIKPDQIIKETYVDPETKQEREIEINIEKELEYWNSFYRENKVDWVSLPESIQLKEEQVAEMKRLIKEYGFDKVLIIPENIVGLPSGENHELIKKAENYSKLHELMTKGYNKTFETDNFKYGDITIDLATQVGRVFEEPIYGKYKLIYEKDEPKKGDNVFHEDIKPLPKKPNNSFDGVRDNSTKLRLVLTKDVKELDDDKFFKQTMGKKPDALKKEFIDELGLQSLSLSEYLIYQREYFLRTRKHLDQASWTYLLNSKMEISSCVPYSLFYEVDFKLGVGCYEPSHSFSQQGFRPSGSFEISETE